MAATKPKPEQLDPVAKRDELLDTLARIDARGDEQAASRREHTATLEKAEADLANLRVQEVKGEADLADVERARDARDEAVAALNEAADRTSVQTARRQVERQLTALIRRHQKVFEAEAEQASATATSAVQQLAPALREAAAAWATAQGAWNRLGRQLDPVDAAPLPEELLFSEVPPFPLPASLDAVQPRPRERQHKQTVELIASQYAVFRDKRKNREVRTVVGSLLWRDALAAPERFEFVRHEDA